MPEAGIPNGYILEQDEDMRTEGKRKVVIEAVTI
jgi:hypothetical protein